MTSKSKTKGSAWERAIVDYLRAVGWPFAERRLANHSLTAQLEEHALESSLGHVFSSDELKLRTR